MEDVLDYFNDEKEGKFYDFADKGKRLGNAIVDGIAIRLITEYIVAPLLLEMGIYITVHDLNAQTLINGFFNLAISFSFYTLMEYNLKGKTIGKMLTGTRAVMETNERMDLGTTMLRSIIRFVPFEAFSFLGQNPSGWHDRWSKTKVIEDVNWEEDEFL